MATNNLNCYKNLSIEKLESILNEIVEGKDSVVEPDRKLHMFTGKLGCISYCKALMKGIGMTEEDKQTQLKELEDKLPGGMYKIDETGWTYCGQGIRKQINID